MNIAVPTSENAEAAYAQLDETDREAVDKFCKELSASIHRKRLEKGIRKSSFLGEVGQRELAAKLYAYVKTRKSAAPEAPPAPKKTIVLQHEHVVNFYPAE